MKIGNDSKTGHIEKYSGTKKISKSENNYTNRNNNHKKGFKYRKNDKNSVSISNKNKVISTKL